MDVGFRKKIFFTEQEKVEKDITLQLYLQRVAALIKSRIRDSPELYANVEVHGTMFTEHLLTSSSPSAGSTCKQTHHHCRLSSINSAQLITPTIPILELSAMISLVRLLSTTMLIIPTLHMKISTPCMSGEETLVSLNIYLIAQYMSYRDSL